MTTTVAVPAHSIISTTGVAFLCVCIFSQRTFYFCDGLRKLHSIKANNSNRNDAHAHPLSENGI